MTRPTSDATQARIFEEVRAYGVRNDCSCDLRPGMTWADLRVLGSGCTDRWVCPTLDKYRRMIGGPPNYVLEAQHEHDSD